MSRPAILQEREKTHGSFKDNAKLSQDIKRIFVLNRDKRPDVQNEALDMIALKLSRIISGQHMTKDHWDDIIGYSQLAIEAIEAPKPHVVRTYTKKKIEDLPPGPVDVAPPLGRAAV